MAMYDYMDEARAGMLYGFDADIETLTAGTTFLFGDPVFMDVGAGDVAVVPLSTDASRVFAGVAAISQRSTNTTEGQYDQYDAVNVARNGKVYVKVKSGETGIAGKPAYVIDLAADGDYKKFTSVPGDNSTVYNTPVGVFRSEIVNGLAVVELGGMV